MPVPTYAWIITRDHLFHDGVGDEDSYGTNGPKGNKLPPAQIINNGSKFRLLDDDGVLYYEGYICGDYDGFEPLSDFGTPYAGATTIQFRNKENEWEDI